MALDNFRRIDMRINRANDYQLETQFAKEGDYNGRELVVQITNAGEVSDQTGVSLNLGWKHNSAGNSGLDNFSVVDASKGIFKITYPTEMLIAGDVTATIQVIENGKITITRNFKITVENNPIDEDAIVSENSFTALQEALVKVTDLEDNYAPRLKEVTAQLAQTMNYLNDYGVNVKSFGAKGDGVTDDTLAIQSALDFVNSLDSKAVVYFPSGTYIVSQNSHHKVLDGYNQLTKDTFACLVLRGNDITLRGDDINRTKICMYPSEYRTKGTMTGQLSNIIDLECSFDDETELKHQKNITFENMELNGGRGTWNQVILDKNDKTSWLHAKGVHARTVYHDLSNVTFSKVRFKDIYNEGAHSMDVDGCEFVDCEFDYCGFAGGNMSGRTKYINCEFKNGWVFDIEHMGSSPNFKAELYVDNCTFNGTNSNNATNHVPIGVAFGTTLDDYIGTKLTVKNSRFKKSEGIEYAVSVKVGAVDVVEIYNNIFEEGQGTAFGGYNIFNDRDVISMSIHDNKFYGNPTLRKNIRIQSNVMENLYVYNNAITAIDPTIHSNVNLNLLYEFNFFTIPSTCNVYSYNNSLQNVRYKGSKSLSANIRSNLCDFEGMSDSKVKARLTVDTGGGDATLSVYIRKSNSTDTPISILERTVVNGEVVTFDFFPPYVNPKYKYEFSAKTSVASTISYNLSI